MSLREIDWIGVAEDILRDAKLRKFSFRIGLVAFLISFVIAFLSLYFSSEDPWWVMGKSTIIAVFAFFVAFYGTLFSVIIHNRSNRSHGSHGDGKGEGEGETDRGTSALSVPDSSEAEAETSE